RAARGGERGGGLPDRAGQGRPSARGREGVPGPRALARGAEDPRPARVHAGRRRPALMSAGGGSAPRPLGSAGLRAVATAAGAPPLTFLALPLVALLLRVSPAQLAATLVRPVVLDALRLSVVTSLAATAIVVVLGLPLAYLLATRDFPGKPVIEVLVDLPMVLPPTVAGFALPMAFRRA